MTNFESIKTKNIDELAEWLDKYGNFEYSPWLEYFNNSYCSDCLSETTYSSYFERNIDCCWCELNTKCKFFPNFEEAPNNKQMIKMWLESEAGE